ncbi:maleylpyruvate isomerase family mycothiol-dependent enzyme [Kribbella sp. NPDC023855]|uniref:maleylpyruvate isomerase family mycothiol-dependent enzyme n=1 Tax=Kribbella sp. NPDC023855 TaxID=3154698 RepID=UPI0033C79A2A
MTDVQEAVAAERRDLADLLAGLPDEDWDSPSLCNGWRVREVVAHLTMPFRYSIARFLLGMVRARGDFHKMADRAARQDAEKLTADELVAVLRANAHHPWKPPGGGLVGALSHDVIHGLDITVALGLDRRVPLDRLQLVLDGIKPKNVRFFGADLQDVVLRADDLDWSLGSGQQELSGSAQDLLLVLCGRKLPPGRVSGAPSSRFTTA